MTAKTVANPPTTAAVELRSAAPARQAPGREAVVASLPAVGANGGTVPAPRGADEVEVCSVGTFQIKMRPDGMPDDDPLGDSKARLDAALASARERAFAALRADRSEQGRAAVLALDLAAAQHKRLGRFEASGCPTSQCVAAFHAAPDPTRDALSGDLARMAVATRDPAVYALAVQACRASTDGPADCRLVSAARWAQLDKGNASPWLSLLSDATRSGDAAAASEALHRMATAQRSDARHFAVSGWIVARIPREVGLELGTWLLATEAFSAGTSPGYSPLVSACKGGALRDPNRPHTCEQIAELLTERSDSLLERRLGASIGKAVGWPAERNDRLLGEEAAYSTALHLGGTASMGPGLGCANVERDLEILRVHAAEGEAGSLRAWVAQSGKTANDFIVSGEIQRAAAASAPQMTQDNPSAR